MLHFAATLPQHMFPRQESSGKVVYELMNIKGKLPSLWVPRYSISFIIELHNIKLKLCL